MCWHKLNKAHVATSNAPTHANVRGSYHPACTTYDGHPVLAGAATGNTQCRIDARYKFAHSGTDANVKVADSAPAAHGDQPDIPQVKCSS
jgi:hypothetical protein